MGIPIGPQRLGLFGRLYRALRNTKYGRLLLELMMRTLGSLILAGLQHPGPLRGPPTAGPTLAMTNLPWGPASRHEGIATFLAPREQRQLTPNAQLHVSLGREACFTTELKEIIEHLLSLDSYPPV